MQNLCLSLAPPYLLSILQMSKTVPGGGEEQASLLIMRSRLHYESSEY